MYRNNNGKQIKMTDAEISALEEDNKKIDEDYAKVREARADEIKNQISGNQKLLDLGLTQAEATALTGYKPPEEE
tara:strand:+ start:6010 stop:6234 length:225 start_codon:yes stop_codon:yes gene_type:complete